MGSFRFRVSPSLVISIAALLIASGGGAMAAVSGGGSHSSAAALLAGKPPPAPVPPNVARVVVKSIAVGNSVVLITAGPFTISGKCDLFREAETHAQAYIQTSQPHSAFNDYENGGNSDFGPSDGMRKIEYDSVESKPFQDMDGPNDGTFAALSNDLKTYITGSVSTAVNIGGPDCTFAGAFFSNNFPPNP
jgi:hypothetical protein